MTNKDKTHKYIKTMKLISLFFFITICSSCGDAVREAGYTDAELEDLSPEDIATLAKRMNSEQRVAFYKSLGVEGRSEILPFALDSRDIYHETIAKLFRSFSQENLIKAFAEMSFEDIYKLVNSLRSEHFAKINDKSLLSVIFPVLEEDNFTNMTEPQKKYAATAINSSDSKSQIECLKLISEYANLKKDFEDYINDENSRIWQHWKTLGDSLSSFDGKMGGLGTDYPTNDSVDIQDSINEMKKGMSKSSDRAERKKENPNMKKIADGATKIFEHARRGALIFKELRKICVAGNDFKSLSTEVLASGKVKNLVTEFSQIPENMDANNIREGVESMSKSMKQYYKFLKDIRVLKDDEDVKKLKGQVGEYSPIWKMLEELEKTDTDVKNDEGLGTDILVNGVKELARLFVSAQKLPSIEHTVGINPNEDLSFTAAIFRAIRKARIVSPAYSGFYGCDDFATNIVGGSKLSWTPALLPEQVKADNAKETLETMIKSLAKLIHSTDGVKGTSTGVGVLKTNASEVGMGGNREKMKIIYNGIEISCNLETPAIVYPGGVITKEEAMDILKNLDKVEILGE